MNVAMTLLVRDEADIVRATVEHHLTCGVDVILATDNGSIDGTRETLDEYAAGGRVRVLDEPAHDYDQWRWVTKMARLAATDHGADWVIHADADEFWWPHDGDLKSVLRAIPDGCNVLTVERHNFPPTAGEDGPFFERQVIRDQHSVSMLGRPLSGKVCHRADPDVWIAQGNHEIHAARVQPYAGHLPLTILHFPLRTYAQLERKIVLGGRAYARNRDLEPWIGAAWRLLYDRYLAGDLRSYYLQQVPDEQQLAAGMAIGRYVVDRRLQRFCRLAGIAARPAAAPVTRHRAAPSSLRAAVATAMTGRGALRRQVVSSVEALLSSPRAGIDGRLEARLVDFIDGARESLDCALVELRATAVASALRDALMRGVAVRIVHDPAHELQDGHGCDPRPTSAFATLSRWALPAAPRPPSGAASRSVLLRHSFVVRDELDVWTGSARPSPEALHRQDNDCLIVHSPAIAARYREVFAPLLSWNGSGPVPLAPASSAEGSPSRPVPLADGQAFVIFTPGDAIRRTACALLHGARRVRVMAHVLSDPPILSALRRARERGADLGGIYNPDGMPETSTTRFVAAASDADAPGDEHGVPRNQLIVVDRAVVLTGSGDFSEAGWHDAENAVVLRSPALGARYDDYVERVAREYGRTRPQEQHVALGEPGR